VEIAAPGYLRDSPDGKGGFRIPVVVFRKITKHDGFRTTQQMTVGLTASEVFDLVQRIKVGNIRNNFRGTSVGRRTGC